MDYVPLSSTGSKTTRLGFGCGATSAGAASILDAAYDAGIRHFDVARAYGHGLAESQLGKFLRRHVGDVTVTTKYGIVPPIRNPLTQLARSALKPIVTRLRRIRTLDRKITTSVSAMYAKADFTGAQARASLELSLRQLGCERVDIFLMHEAAVDDLTDETLLRFLEDSVASGAIGTFGVGGEAFRVPGLYAQRRPFCRVLQFGWSVLDPKIDVPSSFRIHYRAFSAHAPLKGAASPGRVELIRRWSDETGHDLSDASVAAALLLKAALLAYPESIVLFSSQKPEHILANVRAAGDEALVPAARRLTELIEREGRNAALFL